MIRNEIQVERFSLTTSKSSDEVGCGRKRRYRSPGYGLSSRRTGISRGAFFCRAETTAASRKA